MVWSNAQFRAYLSSTAFTGMAFAIHQLLISWLLIGVLLLPADQVGMLQALMGTPGIFIMLWGGASADAKDPRNLLMWVYALATVLPLYLLIIDATNQLAIWSVALWGLGMSVVTSFSMPAQQAILNRVAGDEIQQGVSAATAVGFLVQVIGLGVAGQMERVGLAPVLLIQAGSLAIGAIMIRRLATVATPTAQAKSSALSTIAAGLRATFTHKSIFHVLLINFVSSIFNAGAFVTVFPFIIKRVYDGDATLLATMMAVFFAGAVASNIAMYRFMPFKKPGQLFLLVPLSRILILALLWIRPGWWLLLLATVGWGVNMGFTSTLARTIVQESASPEYRGRIMSVLTLGMLGSAPIGALVLGWIIESFGTLNALLPAMAVSLLLFLYGRFATNIWDYRSPVSR